MKNANLRNLWINFVLLMSILVTGCGGGSGGITSTQNSKPSLLYAGSVQYTAAAKAIPK